MSFSTGTDSLAEQARPHATALLRIVTALLFCCHGASSLFGVLGGAHGHSVPVGQWPGWWAALIQLVGGALVLVGLGTRPAALLCSGSMAYAYFSVHQEHALWPIQNGGELSVLFCWIFLSIAVSGAGSASLDQLLRRGRAVGGTAPIPANAG
ncbi:putative oxidoreductase [Kitasatospora sp. MAP12-15]|uniref:DoxX family protein n=1 Tax=unclassified Kitasatospora TaxID=2633591 RepID=UPI0024746135|nr:DoxX family protein [Kitasatospora sp. MAP12-44]MDH6108113.1 putative oxidoreductase [Kitasatospora sp. MAP12-44]